MGMERPADRDRALTAGPGMPPGAPPGSAVWAVVLAVVLIAAPLAAGCGLRTAAAPAAPAAAAPETVPPAVAPAAAAAAEPTRPTPHHPDRFFVPADFYRGLARAGATPGPAWPAPLAGAVLPHHSLAGELLSRFFTQLESQPVATVFIIGPNHDNRGQPVATSALPWATPFGSVPAAAPLVESLVGGRLAHRDDAALAPEHSIGTLLPYVRYHWPAADVVPLILHHDTPLPVLQRLAEQLAPLLTPDRILLASVDFSHYLPRAEADARDSETVRAVRERDLTALRRMGDDHLDSPPALILWLLTMARAGAAPPQLVDRGNSGAILGNDRMETTSYLLFAAARPG